MLPNGRNSAPTRARPNCLLHGVGIEVAGGLDDGIARAPAQRGKHVRRCETRTSRSGNNASCGAQPRRQARCHSHVGDVSAVGVLEGGVVGGHVVRGGGNGGGVRDGEGDEVADVLNQRKLWSAHRRLPASPLAVHRGRIAPARSQRLCSTQARRARGRAIPCYPRSPGARKARPRRGAHGGPGPCVAHPPAARCPMPRQRPRLPQLQLPLAAPPRAYSSAAASLSCMHMLPPAPPPCPPCCPAPWPPYLEHGLLVWSKLEAGLALSVAMGVIG